MQLVGLPGYLLDSKFFTVARRSASRRVKAPTGSDQCPATAVNFSNRGGAFRHGEAKESHFRSHGPSLQGSTQEARRLSL